MRSGHEGWWWFLPTGSSVEYMDGFKRQKSGFTKYTLAITCGLKCDSTKSDDADAFKL